MSLVGEHISGGICISGRGSIITSIIIRVLCFPSRETHIPSDSVPLPGRFSRDMCFLGRGTHITRHMWGWGGGGGKKNVPTIVGGGFFLE